MRSFYTFSTAFSTEGFRLYADCSFRSAGVLIRCSLSCFRHAVSRTLGKNEVLYKGLYDEISSLFLPAFSNGFTTTYFSESGNTPVEKELFTISVNIVVIGSGINSDLILCMLNGSFAPLILFTVRTLQRISFFFNSEKFVTDKIGKSGISWLLTEEYSHTFHSKTRCKIKCERRTTKLPQIKTEVVLIFKTGKLICFIWSKYSQIVLFQRYKNVGHHQVFSSCVETVQQERIFLQHTMLG